MKNLHISGYFFLEEKNYRLPDAVEAFLAAGEPPVCITFGSMVNAGLKRLGGEILKALEQAEKRAVILTGWGSWDPPRAGSRDILYLDSAPHERLFPRCSLVIHHGSAGTTAAALKAGVPSMAVPLAGDQPFWAKRLDELGVGPQSIPGRRLSARGLSAAMQEAGSSTCRKKAQALGMKLSEEDGISAAISLIEEHMGAFRA